MVLIPLIMSFKTFCKVTVVGLWLSVVEGKDKNKLDVSWVVSA